MLQQLDTFSTDLKKTANENAALKQAANENAALKAKCEKLQKAADKAMELEASLICLREKEKQLTAKASQVDDLSGGDGQENVSLNSSYFLQHFIKLLEMIVCKIFVRCALMKQCSAKFSLETSFSC